MDRAALTRARLIRSASELFAERGWRGATIRAVAAGARANVAAVSYHFGGKRGLYDAVLAASFAALIPPSPQHRESAPEQRLEGFVARLLTGARLDAARRRHARLLARELLDPTGAMERLGARHVGPHFREAIETVAPFLPDDEALRVFGATWLVAQCIGLQHLHDVSASLAGRTPPPPEARVLSRMVLAGLAALASNSGRDGA